MSPMDLRKMHLPGVLLKQSFTCHKINVKLETLNLTLPCPSVKIHAPHIDLGLNHILCINLLQPS